MLLVELKGRRPKRAGKARIEYENSYRMGEPRREKDTIIIPDKGEIGLYRLQPNWNQFLIQDGYYCWFGGTDENPFLVRMVDNSFTFYTKYGPEGFYKALIPVLPGPTYRRQGDIFACPIDWPWEEVIKANKLLHGWDVKLVGFKVSYDYLGRTQGLFNTRHKLKGYVLDKTIRLAPDDEKEREHPWFILAEGTVVAPDHTPMELKGVHALAQTRHLYDPPHAD